MLEEDLGHPYESLLLVAYGVKLQKYLPPVPSAVDPATETALSASSDTTAAIAHAPSHSSDWGLETMSVHSIAAAATTENKAPAPAPNAAVVPDVEALFRSLTLESALLMSWDVLYPLEQLLTMGLEGAVTNRLWSISGENIERDVETKISPMVTEFGADMDAVLVQWLNDAVQSLVVTTELEEGVPEGPEHGVCSLKRLVNVAALISDNEKRSRAVLTLLQTPAADPSVGPISARRKEQGLGLGLESEGSTTCSVDEGSAVVTQLLSLARDSCHGGVRTETTDALTEALKIYRVRELAAKYHVFGIDVRDGHQLRDTLFIIVTQILVTRSASDALEFWRASGSIPYSLSAAFTNVIVSRALGPLEGQFDDDVKREGDLKMLLGEVPLWCLGAVVDDLCTVYVGIIADLSGEARSTGLPYGQLSSLRDKLDLRLACDSVVLTATWFLDHSLGSSEKHEIALQGKSEGGDRSETVRSAVISPEFLSRVKRLRALQLELEMFISLADLSDPEICKDIGRRLAEERGREIAQMSPYQLEGLVPLTDKLHRAAYLLQVSKTFLVHVAAQTLLSVDAVVRLSATIALWIRTLPITFPSRAHIYEFSLIQLIGFTSNRAKPNPRDRPLLHP